MEAEPLPSRAQAFGVGAAILSAIAAAYVASALALAGARVLADPLVRINAIYALIIAFTAGAHLYERAAGQRDLLALRGVVAVPDDEWPAWERRILPTPRAFAAAVLAGAALGLAIQLLGGSGRVGTWSGHLFWMGALCMLLFALLGPMALLSTRRARAFLELGRRARVDLTDPAPLAPFARVGLRGAGHWVVGSSIASFLLIDAEPWQLVVAVNAVTLTIGAAALAVPSRGVHERLRAAKRAELGWTRQRIRAAREALGKPDADSAEIAALPALLAWEARVAATSEWPFDVSTLLRFALLVLLPLGSWLGGALVERGIGAWLG